MLCARLPLDSVLQRSKWNPHAPIKQKCSIPLSVWMGPINGMTTRPESLSMGGIMDSYQGSYHGFASGFALCIRIMDSYPDSYHGFVSRLPIRIRIMHSHQDSHHGFVQGFAPWLCNQESYPRLAYRVPTWAYFTNAV